ncbi:hypothetical protein MBLNU13_g06570t2 [Cladosporium sp. NU13]
MHIPLLLLISTLLSTATAAISWTLERASNPTADQQAAYARINAAMTAAVARHARLTPSISKTIRVYYTPGVPTAEANYNGDLRFGSNAAYQTEQDGVRRPVREWELAEGVAFVEELGWAECED